MNANYHDFIPNYFSLEVLITFIALVAAAIIIGYRSVRVRARSTRKNVWRSILEETDSLAIAALCSQLIEKEPKFKSAKAKRVRKDFSYSYQAKRRGDSVIVFTSETTDTLEAVVAGIVFEMVLFFAYFDGLTQLLINGQGKYESNFYSAFTAALIISGIAVCVAVGFYYLRSAAENLRAGRIVASYIANHNVVPALHEKRTIKFVMKHTLWAFSAARELRALEKAEAKEASGKKKSGKVIPFPFRKVG